MAIIVGPDIRAMLSGIIDHFRDGGGEWESECLRVLLRIDDFSCLAAQGDLIDRMNNQLVRRICHACPSKRARFNYFYLLTYLGRFYSSSRCSGKDQLSSVTDCRIRNLKTWTCF